jgi:LacI family transcriptional regulator
VSSKPTTVWPELTTIRQPIAAMAGSAVELLLRSIRQRKGGDARVVSDHVMAHALIRRDSVAAPRKG